MKKVTFVVACKEFFGFKEGQTLTEFAKELKQLTNEDRVELSKLFPSVGYTITNV